MAVKLVNRDERARLEALAGLADCNPLLPERIAFEEQALGSAFEKTTEVWHAEADLRGLNPNLPKLAAAAEELAPVLRGRLAEGAEASERELVQYEGLVRYLLFSRYEDDFHALILDGEAGKSTTRKVAAFARHERDVEWLLKIPGVRFPFEVDAAHLFAWGFQIRRAWRHTFRQIHGGAMAAARLRAAVWQSVFTHDVQRYRRILYDRMGDVPTLIIGESGTGKELAARAIGLSRYVPFDARAGAFGEDYTELFFPVNLAALSSSLIESELFGHRKGAFTGAAEDRAGWFETCPTLGSVFLDEVGELTPEVQVKLLRVLQSRRFQRVGEVGERSFEGKIIAATNRDLGVQMQSGAFREDFYYRLSGDVIRTPTLREQLDEYPNELRNLALILARRLLGGREGPGDEADTATTEADRLAEEAVAWAHAELGPDYPWRGNVRELEQCVRNVMIRGEYRPALRARTDPGGAGEGFAARLESGELSAEQLISHYCTLVYAQVGNYEEVARRLGLDWRTVKAKIDPELLERLRQA